MTKELLEARVHAEEEFALEAWRARMSFTDMRRLAFEHFGYALSESTLRSLVKSARARVGDLTITREERQERQADEIDRDSQDARADKMAGYSMMNTPAPDDPAERATWAKLVETGSKLVTEADRRLREIRREERDLFGLNAPTKIEAEVTTRDAASAELDAMLARLDAEATA